jgi:hypothetical protein
MRKGLGQLHVALILLTVLTTLPGLEQGDREGFRTLLPLVFRSQVFRQLEPAVLSCLQGYSVCIFTYGQTGTGKTYSMEVGWSSHLGGGAGGRETQGFE